VALGAQVRVQHISHAALAVIFGTVQLVSFHVKSPTNVSYAVCLVTYMYVHSRMNNIFMTKHDIFCALAKFWKLHLFVDCVSSVPADVSSVPADLGGAILMSL
jgi:hypothetical protein